MQPEAAQQTDLRSKSLGEIKVEAFDQDVTINERTQQFAAELLRLALLGIGAIGFVATKWPEGYQRPLGGGLTRWMLLSSLCFGSSTAAALAARYFLSELVSRQLRIVRLHSRAREGDEAKAVQEERARDRRLKIVKPLLLASSMFLFGGAAAIVGHFFFL